MQVTGNGKQYIIVGAGQAGGWAARTLRERGFAGRIVLVGQEDHPPYERPPLSKEVLVSGKDPAGTYLLTTEKLREFDIDVRRSTAIAIVRSGREILLQRGEEIPYDRLLLATGARPRTLSIPGADLKGIHYLRTIEDSLRIRQSLGAANHLLVVGGGWIGLEVAAAAIALGVPVTLVEAGDQLCGRSLPKPTAAFFQELHTGRGVDVRLNAKLVTFEGNGTVERALFADGQSVQTAIVVVGVGVEPNVELAVGCGLSVDNGIVVDETTRTSDPAIFAAGDVASHPVDRVGLRHRLETWHNAQNQGIVAAKAMLDEDARYREMPWFWSDQFDLNFQMLGIPGRSDDIYVKGDCGTGRFVQYFVAGERINAVAAFNSPRELREAKRMMLSNSPLDISALTSMAKVQ
ncbi:FAD-dependent oxidoreductase [Bradyrhizobium sp. CIAT3101]|uniref:NAD(P)/FAD-dependent oxidoreductase n=1 Tax=Bradyrhizobium sp. CIAT3101 TaxID=439387 RepID=UPI0024B16B6D|nr:FAD-dependent oxidoreductase [Bradyrhizobium sp. CIAT3101]WFU79222.1 FAD-dependent oxidoreductase [Bradyrhizobium sp. CIAT3101]